MPAARRVRVCPAKQPRSVTLFPASPPAGPPKGVVLSHRAMVSVIAAQQVVLDQVVTITGGWCRGASRASEAASLYVPVKSFQARTHAEPGSTLLCCHVQGAPACEAPTAYAISSLLPPTCNRR